MKCASYLLLGPCDLLQEENVDGVHFRQVRLTIKSQKVINLLFIRGLLLQLMDVDSIQFWLLLHLLHLLRAHPSFNVRGIITSWQATLNFYLIYQGILES